MNVQQLLMIIAMFTVIGFPISHFIGRKKRIGFGWTLFFSIFLTPVISLIAAIMSPPLNKLPLDNPKDRLPYMLIAILFLLAAIAGFIQALNSEVGITPIDFYRCIGPIGLAIYLFNRSSRNQELYKNANVS